MHRHAAPRRRPDPTITLINVVFLMLTFFLIAGTVAAPLPDQVQLVRLADLPSLTPPGMLALDASGQTFWNGRRASVADYVASLGEDRIARILPDRSADATALVALARDLRNAGVAEVRIVTERAVP